MKPQATGRPKTRRVLRELPCQGQSCQRLTPTREALRALQTTVISLTADKGNLLLVATAWQNTSLGKRCYSDFNRIQQASLPLHASTQQHSHLLHRDHSNRVMAWNSDVQELVATRASSIVAISCNCEPATTQADIALLDLPNSTCAACLTGPNEASTTASVFRSESPKDLPRRTSTFHLLTWQAIQPQDASRYRRRTVRSVQLRIQCEDPVQGEEVPQDVPITGHQTRRHLVWLRQASMVHELCC